MSYSRNGAIGGGGSGGSEIAGSGAAGLVTLWTGVTTISADPSGTWSGTGHTFVIGSPTFNARDGHFTGPAGASFGPSSVGGGFTNQPAGDTIDLVSDDAGDTTQQVTVIGVLAGVDASENITLNGVTPVTSVGTYDLILALVLDNACTGTVTASETSGGLAITTIAPAALSAGVQTFGAIDGYGKVLQIVASGATTKTVGIGGYALGGGIQREPVVLTGTTKVNTTATWEGAVQFYLGDLEATRTVTLNSIAGFDFSPGLISLGTQQDIFLSRASAGTLLVEDGSGNARDVQARKGTFGTSVVTPVVDAPAGSYLTFNEHNSNSSIYYSFATLYPSADGSVNLGSPTSRWHFGNFDGEVRSPLFTAAPDATGTNTAGANLTIQPQAGTGSATGSSIIFQTPTATGSGTTGQTQTTRLTLSEPAVIAAVPVRLKGYTVATLPAGTVGDMAYVTDATAPTYNGALTGGGAVTISVFYNGSAWVSH